MSSEQGVTPSAGDPFVARISRHIWDSKYRLRQEDGTKERTIDETWRRGASAVAAVEVPAMTVNRVCGSGAQAIASAAQEIWLGKLDSAIAGGMENTDIAPYLMGGGRWGYRMRYAQIYDSMPRDGLNDAFSDQHSGWYTEDLVTKFQISREEQDFWAERS